MPRTSRMIVSDQRTVYHVMSRTALDGFPFQGVEKDQMVDIIRRFSLLYFAEILGFCIMSNHFHVLVRMIPENLEQGDGHEKMHIHEIERMI